MMNRLIKMVHVGFSNLGLAVGLFIVSYFAIVALVAPIISPPQGDLPYEIPRYGFSQQPTPPSLEHPLGLTAGQYDIFYGLVWGTRTAFRVGLLVTLGRALIGVFLGLTTGFSGKMIDSLGMRLTDAFLAFPMMAAAVVILTLFGNISQENMPFNYVSEAVMNRREHLLIMTLIAFGWMQYARLMRGNVLIEKNQEYVRAAVSVGVSRFKILFRHILPNASQGLFVLLASDIGAAVILFAAFNFIGVVGASYGIAFQADWGQLLQASRGWIVGMPSNAFAYWYVYVPPSLCIILFSVGWNLVGDGLRDLLDPFS
ncbi:MAG: ABC transporter permease [Anaerolineales bacterium]|nr:ABC transporter permease [Anaerolineales bacterium]